MTACGYSISQRGGWIWADSEIYRDGAPDDAMVKVGISDGGLIGIGTGFAALVGQFRDLFGSLRATSFREAAFSVLPRQLRAARTAKIREMRELGMAYDRPTDYALIGRTAGEIRGCVFHEARDFEPAYADAWLSPDVGIIPSTAAEVLAAAQQQIWRLQRTYCGASGGMLTIARLGAAGIATSRVPLLLGDERAPRLVAAPAPSAVAAETPAHFVANCRAEEAERVRRYWGFG